VYECTPNSREELESIQQKILERIRDLRDQDLPLSEDTALTSYYKMNAEIQNCILSDHTFGPTTLGLVIAAGVMVSLVYYFRIWNKKKRFRQRS